MEQLLLHLLGDYISQNSWMARHKTRNTATGYLACALHATIYTLPFLLIGSPASLLVIGITHFLIDKYRLAVYLMKFRDRTWAADNNGSSAATPPFLAVWLMIITDNTIHLSINFVSLKYL